MPLIDPISKSIELERGGRGEVFGELLCRRGNFRKKSERKMTHTHVRVFRVDSSPFYHY